MYYLNRLDSILDFHRFFQSLSVFSHLQSLNGLLDITIHKARKVVHGEVDTVVGHTVLRSFPWYLKSFELMVTGIALCLNSARNTPNIYTEMLRNLGLV